MSETRETGGAADGTGVADDAVGVELTNPGLPGGVPTTKGDVLARSSMSLAFARLRRDKVALGAGILVVLLVLAAALAPVVASLTGHKPDFQYRATGLDAMGNPVGPNSTFLLGTDDQGRDVLVRTLYGAQISLLVGIVATAVALVVGTTIGLFAGFFGGKTDGFLSRIIDIFLSFPFLVTALTLVTLNNDASGQPRIDPKYLVMAVIATFSWTYFARLVRGQVLSLREREFIEAARSLGASPWRIMRVDILPNLVAPVIVFSTLQIPVNIVLEATLSFLGVGVRVPTASWGNMLSEAQDSFAYQIAPWFLLAPAVALLLTVLGFNLLGDGLRDALDPRSARTMAKG